MERAQRGRYYPAGLNIYLSQPLYLRAPRGVIDARAPTARDGVRSFRVSAARMFASASWRLRLCSPRIWRSQLVVGQRGPEVEASTLS
ncbi:hypothetical protein EVAR_81556_1 [Eumeta japonica]|uniref:Uncharacterized protein n=1 Tax=Eumeta variegata TaxID=151549 RepID=A0A4C1UZX1_EUMVA|nr:hypothetical protein EVAR_81556_1 [Eumeta japonica]